MRSISFSNFILWIFSKKPTVHFWGRPLLRRTTFVRWPQTKTGWLTCGGCASRPRRPALRGQRRQRAFAAEAAQPRRTMLIRRRRTKTGYLGWLAEPLVPVLAAACFTRSKAADISLTHTHIRCSLGVTNNNGWIANLISQLESSQIKPAPDFLDNRV